MYGENLYCKVEDHKKLRTLVWLKSDSQCTSISRLQVRFYMMRTRASHKTVVCNYNKHLEQVCVVDTGTPKHIRRLSPLLCVTNSLKLIPYQITLVLLW